VAMNLQVFQKVLERKAVPAETMIFREGDRAMSAYIVLKGKVRITGKNAAGFEITLTEIGEGQMFGELALMTPDSTRTANAYAIEACELLVVSQAKLKERLASADVFVRYWIEYLSQRVIDLSKRAAK
jgi:CRP/FNR family cyclic AMP-dependent transcriptional regulator